MAGCYIKVMPGAVVCIDIFHSRENVNSMEGWNSLSTKRLPQTDSTENHSRYYKIKRNRCWCLSPPSQLTESPQII